MPVVYIAPSIIHTAYASEPYLVEVMYDSPLGPESPPELETACEGVYCSCVLTARMLGADIPKGDAKDLMPNGPPVIGGVVLLTYINDQGEIIEHMAFIQFIIGSGMWVQEGNKIRGKFTERFIPFSDRHIRGFYYNEPIINNHINNMSDEPTQTPSESNEGASEDTENKDMSDGGSENSPENVDGENKE